MGRLITCLALLVVLVTGPDAWSATGEPRCKVLAVMSYASNYPWTRDIEAGIGAVLGERCDVTYFHMDTKKDLEHGPDKAAEAFRLFEELRPDGVITADDNAQSMFVVPYLRDKTDVPVIFCGVNADPEAYGYPAGNVSGVLERIHVAESISFAKQLVPSIETVSFIFKKSPVGDILTRQINTEKDDYLARVSHIYTPMDLAQALAMAREAAVDSDLLFLETMEGLRDAMGTPRTDWEIFPMVVKAFGGPTTGSNDYAVKAGILCAVVKSGWKQGETAATMLLQAMAGIPPSAIPISQNRLGIRMINVNALRALGIVPRPIILRGAELVKTDNLGP